MHYRLLCLAISKNNNIAHFKLLTLSVFLDSIEYIIIFSLNYYNTQYILMCKLLLLAIVYYLCL